MRASASLTLTTITAGSSTATSKHLQYDRFISSLGPNYFQTSSMRSRFLLVLFGVLATGLLLLTMFWPLETAPAVNQSAEVSTNKLVAPNVPPAGPDNRQLQKGGPQVLDQRARQLSNTETPVNPAVADGRITLSTLSNVIKAGEDRYLEKAIRPIEFYGRVIDEKAEPIEGADVQFSRTYTAPPVSKKSDSNGQFFLTGTTGRYLSVEVSKPGYYATRSNKMSFDYSPELAFSYHRPDPNNPVVFELRKKGQGAELITSQYGMSPELKVQVPRDDTPVMVDLLDRKVGQNGHLQIRQSKPDFSKNEEVKEWSFRMTIPDGGFVEHNDEFPFEAPESGYQSTVSFLFKTGETNWTTILKKQYYIAFGQPRRFGWLSLDTEIITGGARLQYSINPAGSRNLEPK